ncbi:hypothetical protein BDR05DRAFT_757060 [Suillus weaverae]|nr:hypothetical protein BDR05DRAFT_757060 [Suillus weaverae]
MAESLNLIGMECATGAELNTSRCCLPNTRQDLLNDIQEGCSTCRMVVWHSRQGEIGHCPYNNIEHGGLGSCFCFDRTRQADRRQDKIFTTIASELAHCNPMMRRA